MRAIYTELVISQSPRSESGAGRIFDEDAIVLRIEDDASGPYLLINGRTGDGDRAPGTFALDATEIDQFAAICREFIQQAEA